MREHLPHPQPYPSPPGRRSNPQQEVSSVPSLPDELLLAIFELCIPEVDYEQWHVNRGRQSSLRPGAMPWRLTHICRRWRALVVSYPGFWSTLIFPERCRPSHSGVEALALLQLSRAAGHSSLSFYIPYLTKSAVWTALIRRCRRWKYASVLKADGLDDISSLSFPLLEYLQFPAESIQAHFPPLNRTHFPRLHSVAICQNDPSQRVPLQFSGLLPRLNHAAFINPNPNTMVSVVDQIANTLRSLELVDIAPGMSVDGHLKFPQLRRFTAYGVPRVVISAMECPVLEEIADFGIERSVEMVSPWTDLLRNSEEISKVSGGHPLKSLTLRSVYLTRDVHELLKLATNLTTLHIEDPVCVQRVDGVCGPGEYTMEQLLAHLTDTAVCPRLERFALLESSAYPRVIHRIFSFTRFIQQRAKVGETRVRVARLAVLHNYNARSRLDYGQTDLYDMTVRDQLEALTRLRQEVPSLDLHIERRFGEEVEGDVPRVDGVVDYLARMVFFAIIYGIRHYQKGMYPVQYRLGTEIF